MKFKSFLSLLFFLHLTHIVFSQSLKSIESDLINKIKKVQYWTINHTYTTNIDRDKELIKANNELAKSLLFYTTHNSSTLLSEFTQLQRNGMSIVSSSDKKLKIYSWDDGTGGTQRFWEAIYQYKTVGGSKSERRMREGSDDCGGKFNQIYVADLSRKKYYLAKFSSTYMSNYFGQTLKVLRINSNKLILNDLIFNIDGKLLSQISFSYWVNILLPDTDFIAYNNLNNTIAIPKSELKNKIITEKKRIYKFNGAVFSLAN